MVSIEQEGNSNVAVQTLTRLLLAISMLRLVSCNLTPCSVGFGMVSSHGATDNK